MWEPSTVDDIRDWIEGRYVPNPSPEEYHALWLAWISRLRDEGVIPSVCLVPLDHPSRVSLH